MKLPPETISPYLIPQSNQESFTTSASTNSGHSVHQTNVGEVAKGLNRSRGRLLRHARRLSR
jgi:hypothetical protein